MFLYRTWLGIKLMRHYVHAECTPTRVSFQTGRLPMHSGQAATGRMGRRVIKDTAADSIVCMGSHD